MALTGPSGSPQVGHPNAAYIAALTRGKGFTHGPALRQHAWRGDGAQNGPLTSSRLATPPGGKCGPTRRATECSPRPAYRPLKLLPCSCRNAACCSAPPARSGVRHAAAHGAPLREPLQRGFLRARAGPAPEAVPRNLPLTLRITCGPTARCSLLRRCVVNPGHALPTGPSCARNCVKWCLLLVLAAAGRARAFQVRIPWRGALRACGGRQSC